MADDPKPGGTTPAAGEEGAFGPSLAGPGHPKQPADAHGHSGERFLPLADKAIEDGHVPDVRKNGRVPEAPPE